MLTILYVVPASIKDATSFAIIALVRYYYTVMEFH